MKKMIKTGEFWATVVIIFLIVQLPIAVYLGRIYYPENFHPETVSYWENLWVFALFELGCIVGAAIAIGLVVLFLALIAGAWISLTDIFEDIIEYIQKIKHRNEPIN